MKSKIMALGIRTVSIPHLERDINPLKDALVFLWLAKLLRKEKPNILHVNSSKVGGAGAFVGRIMNVKNIVFTAHAWAFNEDRNLFSKWAVMFFHWLTVVLAHRTIAVSEGVRQQMLHLPFMKQRIQTVHLGLEAPEPLSKEEARAKLGLLTANFCIGTIAELHPVKGLRYALEAVASLPFDCSFTIIGEGEERKRLEEQIAKDAILTTRAHLTGVVPEASKFLAAFDLFLLPSLSEAFGYVLLEAGHARIPVIASTVGGIPEIIQHQKSGLLVPPKNVAAITEAITQLHQDTTLRNKLATGLYERVIKEFSLTKMVAETVAVYENKRQ